MATIAEIQGERLQAQDILQTQCNSILKPLRCAPSRMTINEPLEFNASFARRPSVCV
jgi:hypothetical protein